MNPESISFGILVLITITSAVMVVTHRNIVHAAVYLGLSFLGVAGFYLLLNAPFLAGAQVLIYVGAITVLILFALMLTSQRLMREPKNALWWRLISGTACVALCAVLILGVARWGGWPTDGAALELSRSPEYVQKGYLDQLANGLLGTYLLPFEIASVLLLVALVGAIVLAKEEREA